MSLQDLILHRQLNRPGFSGGSVLPQRLRLGGVVTVVLGLVLDRCDVAEAAVQPGLVEIRIQLKVTYSRSSALRQRPSWWTHSANHRLGQGVIERVLGAADGGQCTGVEQPVGVADRGVLAASRGAGCTEGPRSSGQRTH